MAEEELIIGWEETWGMNRYMEKKYHGKKLSCSDMILRVLFYAAFTGVSAMLFWKCRYGFGNIDEAFYLTVPYRFVQGDHMVLHEWHMTQFAGFTMIPVMWIYRLFTSSTEGIILHFRYIFTAVWCAACLYFGLRLRKIHRIGAGFVSLILLAYAPYGVMALSYNSLVLLYLMNSIVFILCAGRHKKAQFTLSGLFFAGAVLCCPYLIGLYVLGSLALLLAKILKKCPGIPFVQADCYTCWRYFTLGATILAVVFLAALFGGVSPGQVIKSMELAMQDPEHEAFSFLNKIKDYYIETVRFNGYIRPLIAGLITVTVFSLIRRHVIWFIAACGMIAVYLWKFVEPGVIINYLMYPLSYAGIYLMPVTKDVRIRWIGWVWLLPGLLGTLCLSFSSNQGFYAISHGAVISSLASVMMLWMYCGELKESCGTQNKRKGIWLLAQLTALGLMFYQLGVEIPVRYDSVFWEQGLMENKAGQSEIAEGPEKGIIALQETAEDYLRTYHDISEINDKKVLFLSYRTWLPLVNENENAAFSAWLSVYRYGMNRSTLDRLEAYYQLCPEKKPEVVFLDQRYADQISYFERELFEIDSLESGNYLIKPV